MPGADCGVCDDDFDDWEFRAEVLRIDKWNDNGTCKAQVHTFHKVRAHNNGSDQRSIKYKYKSILRVLKEGCARTDTPDRSFRTLFVPAGQTRTNTDTLYANYTLDDDESPNCRYDAQAVTEWVWGERQEAEGGDWQSTCGEYILGANCGQ